MKLNPNTGEPWVGDDFHWEKPEFHTFYGIRNPKASYNRILVYVDDAASSTLVFWVNVKGDATGRYSNKREVLSLENARNVWETAINNGWVRDDSVPPRKGSNILKFITTPTSGQPNYGMKA
jgi:hypothetical protein